MDLLEELRTRYKERKQRRLNIECFVDFLMKASKNGKFTDETILKLNEKAESYGISYEDLDENRIELCKTAIAAMKQCKKITEEDKIVIRQNKRNIKFLFSDTLVL